MPNFAIKDWEFFFNGRYDQDSYRYSGWGGFIPDWVINYLRVALVTLNFSWTTFNLMSVPFEQ